MNMPLLRQLKEGVLHLFYPRLCEGCRRQLVGAEEVLCIGCALQLPETGYHHIAGNETELRFAGRVPFEHATTYAYFTNDGLLQHLVHRLKYQERKEIGYYLGRQLGQRLKITDWAQNVDMVMAVPLHKARLAERGYNQSLLVAAGIAGELGIPHTDALVQRNRQTESQTRKTRTERVANMAGAFSVKDGEALEGKHILLCDDVLTTGATLEACANALLAVGNIKISIATIGIAVS